MQSLRAAVLAGDFDLQIARRPDDQVGTARARPAPAVELCAGRHDQRPGIGADEAAQRVNRVFENASAAVLDVYLRTRSHAPHLMGGEEALEGSFVPSALVWSKDPSAKGGTFAVPHEERGPQKPPIGFVSHGKAWVFENGSSGDLVRAAAALHAALEIEPLAVVVPPENRVAWCAWVADHGEPPAKPRRARRRFLERMMELRKRWESQWTHGARSAQATSLMRFRRDAESATVRTPMSNPAEHCQFWVTESSPLIKYRSNRQGPTMSGPDDILPDPSAWYGAHIGAIVAVCTSQAGFEVLFGVLLDNDTMHVTRATSIASNDPIKSLKNQAEILYSETNVKTTTTTQPWVPGMLRVRLVRVRLLDDGDPPDALFQHSSMLPAGMMIKTPGGTSIFRHLSAADICSKWLIKCHRAVVDDYDGERSGAAHRVRLAIDNLPDGRAAVETIAKCMGAVPDNGLVVQLPGGGAARGHAVPFNPWQGTCCPL